MDPGLIIGAPQELAARLDEKPSQRADLNKCTLQDRAHEVWLAHGLPPFTITFVTRRPTVAPSRDVPSRLPLVERPGYAGGMPRPRRDLTTPEKRHMHSLGGRMARLEAELQATRREWAELVEEAGQAAVARELTIPSESTIRESPQNSSSRPGS